MSRLVLTFIICLTPTIAAAVDGSWVLLERKDASGVGTEVRATYELLARTPEWRPESGWPALHLDTAVASAIDKMKKSNASIDSFSVWNISLQHYESNSLQQRWFLVLDFMPVIGGKTLPKGSYWAVVLLDGTVLLPETAQPREMRSPGSSNP